MIWLVWLCECCVICYGEVKFYYTMLMYYVDENNYPASFEILFIKILSFRSTSSKISFSELVVENWRLEDNQKINK